jgi:hypothetical protein
MDYAMKLPIPTKADESNVAVALIKSGRPWMGYTLMVVCRVLWCMTIVGLAIVAAGYGLR